MNFPISVPACLFIGGMFLILGLVYLWFVRGGANYASRENIKRQVNYNRRTPRMNPRVEDDERKLVGTDSDGGSGGLQEWQKLEGQDKGS